MAGTSSFCTKRWVFSETLEKYTNRSGPARLGLPSGGSTSLSVAPAPLSAQCGTGERLDPVRPEAGPMITAGNDDRRLEVTHGHDVIAGFGVLGNVDDVVGQTRLVQGLVGHVALHAGGLGVHGDGHLRMAPQRNIEIDSTR